MRKSTFQSIVIIAACLVFCFANSCNEVSPVTHTYESDDILYRDGDTLLPDYVHSDTLIVTDAKTLNWCMENCDIASDGDINDVLSITTKKAD